jgi:hypothetical protein
VFLCFYLRKIGVKKLRGLANRVAAKGEANSLTLLRISIPFANKDCRRKNHLANMFHWMLQNVGNRCGSITNHHRLIVDRSSQMCFPPLLLWIPCSFLSGLVPM